MPGKFAWCSAAVYKYAFLRERVSAGIQYLQNRQKLLRRADLPDGEINLAKKADLA